MKNELIYRSKSIFYGLFFCNFTDIIFNRINHHVNEALRIKTQLLLYKKTEKMIYE